VFQTSLAMNVLPISIERTGDDIRILWSDQSCRRYRPAALRKACPCAVCREKRSSSEASTAKPASLPILSKAETLPLKIDRMEPVGNYAYNIHFSDGHHSGIFTFDMLISLGIQEPAPNGS
jgi:DUF971 family protein